MKKSLLYLMMSRNGSEPLAKKLIRDIKVFLESLGDKEELTVEEQWKLVCLIYKRELEPEPKYCKLSIGVGALKQFITRKLKPDNVVLTDALASEKNLDQCSPEIQKNIEGFLFSITYEINNNFFLNITKIYWNKVSLNNRLKVLLHLLHLRTASDNSCKNESLPKIEFAITEMFYELLPNIYVKLEKNERFIIKGIRFILNQIGNSNVIITDEKLIAYFNSLIKNINEVDNLKLKNIIGTTVLEKNTGKQLEGILEEYNLLNEFHDKLSALSHSDEERFVNILTNLKNNNLLGKKSINLALSRVTSRLPYPEPDEVEVTPSTGDQMDFKLTNRATKFVLFAAHPGDSGGFGTIRKGYLTDDTKDEPAATVKNHFTTTYGRYSNYSREYEKVDQLNQAIREIKYHRFLENKNSFYFIRNNSYFLVYPWKKGTPMSLHDFTNDTLNMRLQYFISLLHQFDYLHRNYCIHGDVKLNNVIVNEKSVALHLIDYGTARKNASSKSFAGGAGKHDNSFKGDMLALLNIMEKLFFVLDASESNQSVKNDDENLQYSLIKLVQEQLASAINAGHSSERLLNYCQALFSNSYLLNQDVIKETADKILFTKNNSIEDVLRM